MKSSTLRMLRIMFAALAIFAAAGCGVEEMHRARAQADLDEAARYVSLGNLAKAKEWANRALTDDPKDVSVYVGSQTEPSNSIYAVFNEAGDDATTLQYLQEAKQQFPDNLQVLRFMTYVQDRIGDRAAMKATAAELAALVEKTLISPGAHIDADLINTLAQAYWNAGDPAKGTLNYERAIRTYPRDWTAYNDLAYAYAVTDSKPDLARAASLAQTAITLARAQDPSSPDVSNAEDTLGWVLYRQGNYKEALTHLQNAADGDPRQPEVRYHLAMVYLAMEQKDAAKSELIHAILLDKTYADAKQAYDKLNPSSPSSSIT